MKIVPKDSSPVALFPRVTKTMGVYISHPLCETTIKPNILAKITDNEVIHQNEVGLHYLQKDDKAGNFAMQTNFAM